MILNDEILLASYVPRIIESTETTREFHSTAVEATAATQDMFHVRKEYVIESISFTQFKFFAHDE